MNDFTASMESFRRTILQATPDKIGAVFDLVAREGVGLHSIGNHPKPDVIDALREIGIEAGLAEGDVEAILGDACERPVVPEDPAKPAAAETNGRSPVSLVIRRASDIEPELIRWLWQQRIAIGKLTIIAGEPGLGKSQLGCWMTSVATIGGRWPGDEGTATRGSVIILAAEDDAADTVRPRLDAEGADATRVHIVSAVKEKDSAGRRSFNIQVDLALLEREIERIGDVRLVIIDPVSSYLGKVDSHRNAELRAVLEPIGEMASRLGVAVVAITHLNKGSGGTANNRFIGSIAFVAAARAAFIVCRDPDNAERRLFLPTKNNVGPEGAGLGFRVGTVVTASGIVAPTILFDSDPVTVSADQALASAQGGREADAPVRTEAENFLKTILADGPLPTRRIESEAKAAGLSWATVRRAKDRLHIAAAKVALDGGWTWSLPEDVQEQ